MVENITAAEVALLKEPSMDRKPHERRLFARHDAAAPAVMLFDGGEHKCDVLDISSGGVQVRAGSLPTTGDMVVLRLGTIGEISAKVVWQHSDRCGLEFVGDADAINELVMAIAIYG